MTKRPDEIEISALRSLVDATPTSYGPSPYAATEAALREQFPDLEPFELAFAFHQGAPLQKLPPGLGIDTVGRITALREAESRIGLSRQAFHEIVTEVLPRLFAGQLSDPDAIEAGVRTKIKATTEIVAPLLHEQRRSQTRSATEALQARREHWAERAAQLRDEGLSLEQIAIALSGERHTETDVRTVSRWLATTKP